MSDWMSLAGVRRIQDETGHTTRAAKNAAHNKQYRETGCTISHIETSKCMSHAHTNNPALYWMLRTHPINVYVGGIMFYLGSVVDIYEGI